MWLSLGPPAALSSALLLTGSHSLMTLLTSASLSALKPLPEAAWHSPSHGGQAPGHVWLNDALPGAAEHSALGKCGRICNSVCLCVLLHMQCAGTSMTTSAGHAPWDSYSITCGICAFQGISAMNFIFLLIHGLDEIRNLPQTTQSLYSYGCETHRPDIWGKGCLHA